MRKDGLWTDYNEEGWFVDGIQGGRMGCGWITRRKDGLWMDYKEEGWVKDGFVS